MKKNIFIMMFMALMCQASLAQENYTEYKMTYVNKSYSIQVSKNGSLYIDLMPMDKMVKVNGIVVEKEKSGDLIACFDTALKKFTEWKEVAIKNKVTDLQKDIPCTCKIQGYFQYGKWQFDYNVKPTFEFLILHSDTSTKYLMIMRTGEMVSSSNQYMKTDGGAIAFGTPEEFKDFTDKISNQSVDKFLNGKTNKEELFK